MNAKRAWRKFFWKYGTSVSILLGCGMIAISIYVSFGIPNSRIEGLTRFGSGNVVPEPDQGRVEVGLDNDPVLGESGALVTIVEFSDFQCPFCRSFWRDTLPQIKKNFIDSGKVKFVYRDFPLPIHPSAPKSAEAAECAREQGQYWEMHDKIFSEQDLLGQGTVQYDVNDLKNWAREIGLNTKDFNSCLDSGKYQAEVEKDLADGQRAGVSGTPTIFINGRRVVGAQPYTAFAQVIEEELGK